LWEKEKHPAERRRGGGENNILGRLVVLAVTSAEATASAEPTACLGDLQVLQEFQKQTNSKTTQAQHKVGDPHGHLSLLVTKEEEAPHLSLLVKKRRWGP
jgi:hypothetical protein